MATTNINRVVLTGNLTRDPVLRNTNSGSVAAAGVGESDERDRWPRGRLVDSAIEEPEVTPGGTEALGDPLPRRLTPRRSQPLKRLDHERRQLRAPQRAGEPDQQDGAVSDIRTSSCSLSPTPCSSSTADVPPELPGLR
jgi:hypothetical protein